MHKVSGSFEHVSDEGDDVEAGEGGGVALVVFDQPSASGHPGEGSFDDPASWQQDEAPLGLGEFDHAQFDSVGRCGFCGFSPV